MKVVTFANKDTGYFPAFIESAKRFNVYKDLVIVGWGMEWKGFGGRMLEVLKYVETLKDDEVVVVVDAFDVVFLKSLKGLEEEYIEFCETNGRKVVFPSIGTLLTKLVLKPMFGNCKGHYINAGTYIGYASVMKDVMSKLCANRVCDDVDFDDQRGFTILCNEQYDLFAFDTDANWFLCWGPLEDLYIRDKVSFTEHRLLYNGHEPYILHRPVNADLNPILRKLGYHASYRRRTPVVYLSNILKNHCKYLGRTYGAYIVGVVVLFILACTGDRTHKYFMGIIK